MIGSRTNDKLPNSCFSRAPESPPGRPRRAPQFPQSCQAVVQRTLSGFAFEVQLRPSFSHLGRFGPFGAMFGRTRPRLAPLLTNFADLGQILARFTLVRPNVAIGLAVRAGAGHGSFEPRQSGRHGNSHGALQIARPCRMEGDAGICAQCCVRGRPLWRGLVNSLVATSRVQALDPHGVDRPYLLALPLDVIHTHTHATGRYAQEFQ